MKRGKMAYFLKDLGNGAGSSGPLSATVKDKNIDYHCPPKVGYCIQVGPLCIGGTVEPMQTDEVLEILLKMPNFVRFRTATSTYEWWEK